MTKADIAILAFAIGFCGGTLLTVTARGQTLASPPLVSVPWSNLNPDMVGVQSSDRSAGASAVRIDNNIGIPMGFSIWSAQTDVQQIVYQPHPTDTAAAIAKVLCDEINSNSTLKAGNVSCQLQGGSSIIGVTHYNDNPMNVTALSAGMQIWNGSLSWDAGPILVCERIPPNAVPPPGSSICQIIMGAATSGTPGIPSAQYVMLQGKVLNGDTASAAGQFEIYTVKPDGFGNLGLRLVAQMSRGFMLCDANLCAPDLGEGTVSIPPNHADGLGPGLFLGTRKLCIAPPGTVGPGGIRYDGYVYAAQGAACPPGQ